MEKSTSEENGLPLVEYERRGRAQVIGEDTQPVWQSVLWYLLTCAGVIVGIIGVGALVVLLFSR